MSIVIEPTSPTARTAPRHYRFSATQYMRMVESGILPFGTRCELINGEIIAMSPMAAPHALAVSRCDALFHRIIPTGWHIRCQVTLDLGRSLPDPDFQFVRGRPEDFSRLTTARDLGLIVEIADSTLKFDRKSKGRLYARNGIPTYWIINLNDGIVEVYSEPRATGYASRRDYFEEESVPLTLDGTVVAEVRVDQML